MTKSKEGMQYWHRIVILLCVGWIAIWIYRTVLTPIYDEIQVTIGPHTATQMGAIASLYFFPYTAMQIPSGILADKIGKKNMLIPSFILFAISAVVIGLAKNINMIYVGSMLAGLSTGAYYGSAYALAGSTIPRKNLTVANAIINSGTALGMALGLIGSSLIVKTLHAPWYTCLFILGGISAVMAVVFYVVVKPDGKHAVHHPTDIEVIVEDVESGKSFLFTPMMISCYILYFANCYSYYMLVTWLPNFLETEKGFQGIAIGMSAALIAFSAIPGALYFSRKADKFQDKRIILIVTLEFLAALMLVAIVLAPTSGLLLVGLISYGLVGKVATDPILISFITSFSPRKRLGTSLAVFNFFGMSSSVLAPVVTGMISDKLGSKVMGFYISVVLLLVSATIFAVINTRKKVKTTH